MVDELFVPATQRPSDPEYYVEDCRIQEKKKKSYIFVWNAVHTATLMGSY